MNLNKLITALLNHDPLTARQWVADASRLDLDWMKIPQPEGLDESEMAVAAGVAELLAQRAGQKPPPWTSRIGIARRVILLVKAAEVMPRLRKLCETEGPEPLRKRGILAPPEFLRVA